METVTLETIYRNLKFVRKEIVEIKKHMVDIDSIMTKDDYEAFEEYKRERTEGKLEGVN